LDNIKNPFLTQPPSQSSMNTHLNSYNSPSKAKNAGCICWPLTQRGFFSELLVFSLVLYYGFLENAKVTLLVSESSVLPPSLLEEFISYPSILSVNRLDCYDVFASSKKGKILQFFNYGLRRKVGLPAYLFRQLWLEDILCLEDRWDKEVLGVFSKILNDLIVIPRKSADILRDLPFSDLLENGYVCIHVRRGDKLVSEAREVEGLEYLARIPARFASLPVVVITDDYKAYLDLAKAIGSTGSCRKIYTTAPIEARGYDNGNHYRSTHSQRRDELYHLLADFRLATESSFFVGTYSSNVGRAVYISRGGADVDSVDGDFRLIW
jgi:hypothetical protein